MQMRFNHMELTFPVGTLTQEFRDDVKHFYGDQLGWDCHDVPGLLDSAIGQCAFIMSLDEGQFILLAENKNPMNQPSYDHLGLYVETRTEVDELLNVAEKIAAEDSRMEIKTYEDLQTPNMAVHAFYFRYMLPIHFDVQCHEYKEGASAKRKWILVDND